MDGLVDDTSMHRSMTDLTVYTMFDHICMFVQELLELLASLLGRLSNCEDVLLGGLDSDARRGASMSDGMVGSIWDGLLNGKVEVSLSNVRRWVDRLSISSVLSHCV